MSETVGRRLGFMERRRLGFTVPAVIEAARKVGKPQLDGLPGEEVAAARQEFAEAIALEVMGAHATEWAPIVQEGRDWAAFFEALMKFIEMIMPFIMMFM